MKHGDLIKIKPLSELRSVKGIDWVSKVVDLRAIAGKEFNVVTVRALACYIYVPDCEDWVPILADMIESCNCRPRIGDWVRLIPEDGIRDDRLYEVLGETMHGVIIMKGVAPRHYFFEEVEVVKDEELVKKSKEAKSYREWKLE